VLGLLSELRARALELCERVLAHNAQLAPSALEGSRRVIAYVGQTVIEAQEKDDDRDEDE